MNKDIAEKWVEALRSGKYAQGTGVLRQKAEATEQFCCLGVLCDLYQQETGGPGLEYATPGSCVASFEAGEYETLPAPVREWAEMRTDYGHYGQLGINIASSLVDDNDNGRPFEEIADIIETVWERL